MGRDDDWEDDDDRPRRRRDRDRDRYDDEDDEDYDRGGRRGKSGTRSGAVTSVGVLGIILGSLDLLFGLCLVVVVLFMGDAGGRGGAFALPGFGGAMALVVIMTLVVLLWGALMISSGVGVLNRRSWARVMVLVLTGIGAAFGLLCLIAAFGALSVGANVQGAGGAGFMGFLIYFLIAAILIGYCVLSYIVLLNSRNASEFR
jgi:hypothetical protein